MKSLDLTPLYRNTIGFDRFASLLDDVMNGEAVTVGYPPYNIEMLDDNRYTIALAVAGFDKSELDINVEKGVLTIGSKKAKNLEHKYLHQGIANRSFERKFDLADYVEVTGADLHNGLLTISLVKEIPEKMKPKSIPINQEIDVLEHKGDKHHEEIGKKAA